MIKKQTMTTFIFTNIKGVIIMISNLIICTRDTKKKGKKEFFISEPGATRYLEVNDGNFNPHPTETALNRGDWLEKVINRATNNRKRVHPKGHPLEGYTYGDILIFVHGYNNSIKDIMIRHDLLQKNLNKLGFKGAIVSFDWPSANAALNYLEDRSDALKTAESLVKDGIMLLAMNQANENNLKCDVDIHLIGHSTGAYVIREAFYKADQNRKLERINWNVSQVAIIGGDISRKSMQSDDKKSSSLFAHATRITNYQNPRDSALKLSNVKRFGTQPRVGRVGVPDNSPSNVVNVNVEKHWLTLEKVKSSANWSHSWHFYDEYFCEDLLFTINGDLDRHSIPTRVVENGKLYLRKN